MTAAATQSRALCRALRALPIVLVLCSGPALAQDYSSRDDPGAAIPSRLTPLDKIYLLRLARLTLYGDPKTAGEAPSGCLGGAGTPVFVTLYGPEGASVRGRATGRSLVDSAARAAVQAKVEPGFTAGGLEGPGDVRIQIDVLAARALLFPHPRLNLVLKMAPGLDGLSARQGGRQGYVLPGEIVVKEMTGRSKMLKLACRDAGLSDDAWHSLNTEVFRIRTFAFMEEAAGGGKERYLDLYRAAPLVHAVRARDVESAVHAATQWLLSVQIEDGSFPTFYGPRTGEYERKLYNVSRHAEATRVLFVLYRRRKTPALLAAGEKATAFLAKHIVPAEPPETFSLVHEHVHGKLGPAALAVLALLERRAATGKKDQDDSIVKLGRFLQYMQKQDGSFYPIYEFKKRVKRDDISHRHYPGMALLALVRLYGATGEESFLKAALNGAHHVITQRDAELKREEPLEDRWVAMGLAELFAVSSDLAHADYCFAVAETIHRHQLIPGRTAFLDYLGASDHDTVSGNPPGVAATATRCQALNAAAGLARRIGVPSGDYRRSAAGMVRFVLQNQYTPRNSYYLPDAARAMGGFRVNFIEHKIELDCVVRCLSALLSADVGEGG